MTVTAFNISRGTRNWGGDAQDKINEIIADLNSLTTSGITNNTAFSSYVNISATSVTLSTLSTVNSVTFTASGQTLKLPSASGESTVYEGGLYAVHNAGSESFDIDDNGDNLIHTLTPGQSIVIGCADNSTAAGTWVIAARYDADTLLAAVTDELEVGYSSVVYNGGTQTSGTYTPDEANGFKQRLVNGGAFTLAPPSNYTNIELYLENNASAGVVTTTGFDIVAGDSLTTTDGNKFVLDISTTYDGSATFSRLNIQAAQ